MDAASRRMRFDDPRRRQRDVLAPRSGDELDADRQARRATSPPRTTTAGQPVRLWTSLYVSPNQAALLSPWRIAGWGIAGQTISVGAGVVEPAQQPRPDRVRVLEQRRQLVARDRRPRVDPAARRRTSPSPPSRRRR